jgi:hypothetical protein
MSIDIVVPVAPKDFSKLPSCLRGIAQHSQTAIRRIYVLSQQAPVLDPLPGGIPVHHAPESWFPFTKQDISRALEARGCPYPSGCWYYQQLLKLYVFRAIPGLLPEVLILDSDYVFLQDIPFLSEDGRALLAMGYPFTWLLGTRQYPSTVEHVHADFARRFVPGWSPQHPFSGMQHHMLFQADILEELLFGRLMARRDLQAAGCHAFLGLRERLETMDYIPPQLRTRMLAADSLVYTLHLKEGLLQLECMGEPVLRAG